MFNWDHVFPFGFLPQKAHYCDLHDFASFEYLCVTLCHNPSQGQFEENICKQATHGLWSSAGLQMPI